MGNLRFTNFTKDDFMSPVPQKNFCEDIGQIMCVFMYFLIVANVKQHKFQIKL